MVEKKGLKLGGQVQKPTKTELDVMYLLCNEFLTVKQASLRRKTSVQNIYKIKKSLIRKGLITINNSMVENNDTTFKPLNDFKLKKAIRLHAQEFNIGICYKDNRYKEKIGTVTEIDGNTLKLNRDSLELYSSKSFFAETAQKATAKSIEYWRRIFPRIEDKLKIIILKKGYQNIKMVRCGEYSEIDNELSIEAKKKGLKYKVFTTEDSKLWFEIDNSFNLHEAETKHSQTSEDDMENIIAPFFNDLRDNKPPKMSELAKVLQILITQTSENASGLNAVTTLLKRQLEREEQLRQPQESELKDKPEYIG
jgi:hypothetical protein